MKPKQQNLAPLKVLFLTSKLGCGHIRAANAIEESLREKEPTASFEYLDLWSLMDEEVATAVKDGYLRMTREYPDYYQKLYDLDEGAWRQLSGEELIDRDIRDFLLDQQRRWFPDEINWFPVGNSNLDTALLNSLIRLLCVRTENMSRKIVLRSLLLLMRSVLLSRMKDRIQRIAPNMIIATQMYPAALLSHLKRKEEFRDIPTLGVITDFGLQTVWVRPTTERYCVASKEVVDQLLSHDVTAERIYQTGIPLGKQFKRPPDTASARRLLGLDPKQKTIVVTGGQYGIGVIDAVADLLHFNQDYHVVVTASGDDREKQKLERLALQYVNRITVLGWRDDMATVLSAADVVVGKPGGLSVSEALACGRPFIATCSLGGQERHNVEFLRRHRVGKEVTLNELGEALADIFSSPQNLASIKSRAYALGHRDGADKVAYLVRDMHRQQHAQNKNSARRTGR